MIGHLAGLVKNGMDILADNLFYFIFFLWLWIFPVNGQLS